MNNALILAFDGNWESQYTTAKPILERYGFNATYFIVCNYVGRESLGNDIQIRTFSWHGIEELHDKGYNIKLHIINHANLSNVSQRQLEHSTLFAYPHIEGSDNATL